MGLEDYQPRKSRKIQRITKIAQRNNEDHWRIIRASSVQCHPAISLHAHYHTPHQKRQKQAQRRIQDCHYQGKVTPVYVGIIMGITRRDGTRSLRPSINGRTSGYECKKKSVILDQKQEPFYIRQGTFGGTYDNICNTLDNAYYTHLK